MMKKVALALLASMPLTAVVGIAVAHPGGLEGGYEQSQCQTCIDDKQADPGTTPDYETKCYPNQGLPPVLKRSSCQACLQDLCGNACGGDHAPEKCGTP